MDLSNKLAKLLIRTKIHVIPVEFDCYETDELKGLESYLFYLREHIKKREEIIHEIIVERDDLMEDESEEAILGKKIRERIRSNIEWAHELRNKQDIPFYKKI